jgi:hypothetical protein
MDAWCDLHGKTLRPTFESTLITWPDGRVAMSEDDGCSRSRVYVGLFCSYATVRNGVLSPLSCIVFRSSVSKINTNLRLFFVFILHNPYFISEGRQQRNRRLVETKKVGIDQREFYILWGKQMK